MNISIKNKLWFVFIIIAGLILSVSCDEKKPELEITCDDLTIYTTETINLKEVISNNIDNNCNYIYNYIGDNFTIEDDVLTGVNPGVDYLYIEIDGYSAVKEVKVEVKQGTLEIKSSSNQVLIYDQLQLELVKQGISDKAIVSWNSSDKSVAKVSTKGVVTAVYFGTTTITASVGDIKASIDIEVLHLPATDFNIEENPVFEVGNTYTFEYVVLPEEALSTLVITNNSDIVKISEDNTIKALKEGTCEVTLYPTNHPELTKTISIQVLANEAPVFTKESDYLETCEVNYNNPADLLQGLSICDNADGDLSDKIEYDADLIKAYGEKDITITVADRAGNISTFSRHINVVYKYHTKFIGHAGCWNAVPNSEEAFLIAARDLKYQLLECDLQVTSDGVYVLNHDSYIDDFVISKHTYKELQEIVITDSSNHTAHACTLERYFEICKEYNCEAVVEVKGSSPGLTSTDTSNVDKLIKYIKAQGMYDQTIILCANQSVILKIRELGYDIRTQYLVNTADNQPTLNFCIETHSDLSTNVTYGGSNTMKWLQKYWDAGLKISCWTFSGAYSQIQEWIDKGVEYVTTDCHVMDQLNLK